MVYQTIFDLYSLSNQFTLYYLLKYQLFKIISLFPLTNQQNLYQLILISHYHSNKSKSSIIILHYINPDITLLQLIPFITILQAHHLLLL